MTNDSTVLARIIKNKLALGRTAADIADEMSSEMMEDLVQLISELLPLADTSKRRTPVRAG